MASGRSLRMICWFREWWGNYSTHWSWIILFLGTALPISFQVVWASMPQKHTTAWGVLNVSSGPKGNWKLHSIYFVAAFLNFGRLLISDLWFPFSRSLALYLRRWESGKWRKLVVNPDVRMNLTQVLLDLCVNKASSVAAGRKSLP